MHTNLLSAQQIYAGDSEKMEHLIFPSLGLTMVMLKKNPFIIYRALKATACLTSERVKPQTFLNHLRVSVARAATLLLLRLVICSFEMNLRCRWLVHSHGILMQSEK